MRARGYAEKEKLRKEMVNHYMNRNFGYSRTCGGGDHEMRGVGNSAFVTVEKTGRNSDQTRASDNGCCKKGTRYGIKDRPVGSVYAPVQNFHELYDLDKALSRGTIFSELDLPFDAGRGCGNNGGVRHG